MMNKISYLFSLSGLLLFVVNPVFGQERGVAKVLIMKGQAKYRTPTDEKYRELSKGTWLVEGTHVKTSKKSFVKLLFIDKSTMNVGPNSSMAIKKFSKKESGIVSLLRGQIRAKVTKNYLEIKKTKQSKLFIKTKSAALGVRGTDFHIAYNPKSDHTSILTFEGEVAFVKLSGSAKTSLDQSLLDRKLNSGLAVKVNRGQYSGVTGDDSVPTDPVQINPVQLESLKQNDVGVTKIKVENTQTNATQTEEENKKEDSQKTFGKRTPPGISSNIFTPKEDLGKQIGENLDPNAAKQFNKDFARRRVKMPEAGEMQGGAVKVDRYGDLRYIPPPPSAEVDPNTGLAILSNEAGNIEDNGNFTESKDARKRKGVLSRSNTRSPASIDGPVLLEPRDASADAISDIFAPGNLPQDQFINSAPAVSPNDFGRVFININAQ